MRWLVAVSLGAFFGCDSPCVAPGEYEFFGVPAFSAGTQSDRCRGTLSGSITWHSSERASFEIEGFRGTCVMHQAGTLETANCQSVMQCEGVDDAQAPVVLTTVVLRERGEHAFVDGLGGRADDVTAPAQWIEPARQCVGLYSWAAAAKP